MTETGSFAPKTNRIELLDCYRGFAIFGIFVVNITVMHSTYLGQDEFLSQFTAPLDEAVKRVMQLFFYTKFFPIFSLLFGLGIAMQVLKFQSKNEMFWSFFARRMAVLFLFGVLHITLLWSGDVLHLYAVLGMLAVLLIKLPNRVLLILSLLVLVFPFYEPVLASFFEIFSIEPGIFLSGFTGARVHEIIAKGSYIEGLYLRLREYPANLPMLLGFLAPLALSMFLLGLYLGKKNVYSNLKTFITRLKNPVLIIAILTNLYRIAFLFFFPDYAFYREYRPLLIQIMSISDVAMGLFYLWLLGYCWYFIGFQRILKPLQYVGKMALTNYILQSFIGLMLFSSVGFGFYERFSPLAIFVLAVVVFIIQVFLSKIWLYYFRFGPLEWLWRCLSYKRFIPITVSKQ